MMRLVIIITISGLQNIILSSNRHVMTLLSIWYSDIKLMPIDAIFLGVEEFIKFDELRIVKKKPRRKLIP